jgi:MFS family permease
MSIAPPSRSAAVSSDSSASYTGPLAVVTTLFFMWGFLTCLNDILVPHLKPIFDLNYTEVMLIQFAFFGAYFLFSIPSAKVVDWIGYQRSMVVGLLTMGVGAFLFVPAASVPSFPLFLVALIVLAAGITCLQVAANPYVTVLGKPETASSRLNLTQAFNSLGTFLAPFFGGLLILTAAPKTMEEIRALAPDAMQAYRLHEAATVKTPYVGLGIALVLLAIAIGSFKLPKIPHARLHLEASQSDLRCDRHFRIRWRRSLHRKFSGELLQPARDWRFHRKGCGEFRRLLLGRGHGGAFHRIRAATEDEDRAPTWHLRSVRRRPRDDFHAHLRPLRHVEHHPGRVLQLNHVPKHFHSGCSGTGPAYRRWFGSHDHGDRRRCSHPASSRRDRRQDWYPPCLLSSRDLLSLHPVLRSERFEAQQRTPRRGVGKGARAPVAMVWMRQEMQKEQLRLMSATSQREQQKQADSR